MYYWDRFFYYVKYLVLRTAWTWNEIDWIEIGADQAFCTLRSKVVSGDINIIEQELRIERNSSHHEQKGIRFVRESGNVRSSQWHVSIAPK